MVHWQLDFPEEKKLLEMIKPMMFRLPAFNLTGMMPILIDEFFESIENLSNMPLPSFTSTIKQKMF